MITAALALLLVIFTVIKFLADGEFRTFWAWIGLALAIVVAVGASMSDLQAAGESFRRRSHQGVVDDRGQRGLRWDGGSRSARSGASGCGAFYTAPRGAGTAGFSARGSRGRRRAPGAHGSTQRRGVKSASPRAASLPA